MKFQLSLLILATSFSILAQTKSLQHSPPLAEALPEEVGMSAERLSRIDKMCEKAVADGNIPGVVALVARHGKIVYWKAFGMADEQAGRAMKRDDIFRIASQSKAITSTAVMMLWEEGHFQLDDPVSKYIPAFKNPEVLAEFRYSDTSYSSVPAGREITIRHLLTHTSGLGYGMIDKDERFRMIYQKAGIIDLYTTKDISIEENVKKLAALPLHHAPGEEYTYSEGLDVLGYFVEVISGMPFDVFLRTRLFDPLGMHDTWFYLPESRASRLVTIQHKRSDGKWHPYPHTFYDPLYPVQGARRFFSGGAGLCSTAKDYATFLQMYLNGGELNGIRILSRTTIRMMMGNQTGEMYGSETGRYHGIGFGVIGERGQDLGGRGAAGSFYWGGYFNTQGLADPREDLVLVLMKQTRDHVGDNTGWQINILGEQAIDD